jgi:hypothetical protein
MRLEYYNIIPYFQLEGFDQLNSLMRLLRTYKLIPNQNTFCMLLFYFIFGEIAYTSDFCIK